MSHNLKALKRLGKKITSQDMKGDSIKEVLDDLTKKYEGVEGLPDASELEDGTMLVVADGEWTTSTLVSDTDDLLGSGVGD